MGVGVCMCVCAWMCVHVFPTYTIGMESYASLSYAICAL